MRTKKKRCRNDNGSSVQAAEQIFIVKVHAKERKIKVQHHKPMTAAKEIKWSLNAWSFDTHMFTFKPSFDHL